MVHHSLPMWCGCKNSLSSFYHIFPFTISGWHDPTKTRKKKNPWGTKGCRKAYKIRIALQEIAACTTCQSNVDTITLEHQSNKQLKRLLGTHSISTSFAWPNIVDCFLIDTIVTESLFLTGVIPKEIADDRLLPHSNSDTDCEPFHSNSKGQSICQR